MNKEKKLEVHFDDGSGDKWYYEFTDHNYATNLVNLKKALNNGFECYFAKWGYGDRYMINQSNIYHIDLANISQLLPTKL